MLGRALGAVLQLAGVLSHPAGGWAVYLAWQRAHKQKQQSALIGAILQQRGSAGRCQAAAKSSSSGFCQQAAPARQLAQASAFAGLPVRLVRQLCRVQLCSRAPLLCLIQFARQAMHLFRQGRDGRDGHLQH